MPVSTYIYVQLFFNYKAKIFALSKAEIKELIR